MVALLYGPLLAPGALLAFRDLPFFHLPLRTTLATLVASGEVPLWNSFLNGGQPILSNPNYAAFYPPTWLFLLVGPTLSLSLGIVLHAGLGCGGAIFLARRLGCSPWVGALAGVAWAGSGVVVSNASTYTFFSALAWWPWVLAWGLALGEEHRWFRPAVLTGLGLALQLLAGEPVVVLLTALTLTALLVARPWGQIPWRRLAAAGLLAALLGAVQLVPAGHRVANSGRADRAFHEEALGWSVPPLRLLEVLLPRIHGDPMRLEEDLYFGWTINDRSFPYIPSFYPGLFLVVLGFSALLRRGILHRGGWVLAMGVATFLALGRHNPLLVGVREYLPLLNWVRFPEKFLVPAVLCLVLAGVLGWQRLLDQRRAGERRGADFPLALGLGVWVLFAGLATLLYSQPALGRAYLLAHGPPIPPSAERIAAGVAYLQQQSLIACGFAGVAVLWLSLLRWSSLSSRWLTTLVALGLALELGFYGHGFLRVGAAADFQAPPAALATLADEGARIFTDAEFHRDQEIYFRSDAEAGFRQLRLRIERADPYLGTVWGLRYVGNTDYDRMLTPWARHAQQALEEDWWRDRDLAFRFLGAWGVQSVLLRRSPEELVRARAEDGRALPMRLQANGYSLPLVRSVPRVEFQPRREAALEAARGHRYGLPWQDYFVVPEAFAPAGTVVQGAQPQRLRFAEYPGRVEIRTDAQGGILVVVAVTFDPGWRAVLIGSNAAPVGQEIPLYPTALGQIGFSLPPGEHQLTLRYHQRGLLAGVLLSLCGLAGAVLLWCRGGLGAHPSIRRRL